MTSPWVQRNNDYAQYAQSRGSQYEGAYPVMSDEPDPGCPMVLFGTQTACGEVTFGNTFCDLHDTCACGQPMAHNGDCGPMPSGHEDDSRFEEAWLTESEQRALDGNR